MHQLFLSAVFPDCAENPTCEGFKPPEDEDEEDLAVRSDADETSPVDNKSDTEGADNVDDTDERHQRYDGNEEGEEVEGRQTYNEHESNGEDGDVMAAPSDSTPAFQADRYAGPQVPLIPDSQICKKGERKKFCCKDGMGPAVENCKWVGTPPLCAQSSIILSTREYELTREFSQARTTHAREARSFSRRTRTVTPLSRARDSASACIAATL